MAVKVATPMTPFSARANLYFQTKQHTIHDPKDQTNNTLK